MNIIELIKTPEFFDIFGMSLFLIIVIFTSKTLITKKPMPKWFLIFLLITATLALIIDSYLVIQRFLL